MLGRAVRRGGRPGLIGVAARTAVVAGTASAVSGRVSRHQAERSAAQEAATQPPAPAPAPAPPTAAPGTTEDAISQLERLGRLRDQGILSDEEFTAEKARVLNR